MARFTGSLTRFGTARSQLYFFIVCLTLPVSTRATVPIEFIYLEANTGSASGGHVALKRGEQVFHFQNDRGSSRLSRDEWGRFRHTYNNLENRNIHLARVPLRAQDAEQIGDHLNLLFLVQNRQLDFLSALQRDVHLLEAFQTAQPATLPGVGFFSETQKSPVMSELRHNVEEALGSDFIMGEMARLRLKLTTLLYGAPAIETAAFSTLHYPNYPSTFSEQIEDLYTRWFALNIIQKGLSIRENGLINASQIEGPSRSSPLTDAERVGLTAYRFQLRDSILTALKSEYIGGASPLPLAVARFQATSMSLASDSFLLMAHPPEDGLSIPLTITEDRRPLLNDLRQRLIRDLPRLRRAFGEMPEELPYHQLEDNISTLQEVEHGLKTGQDIRVSRRSMSPRGMGLALLPMSRMSTQELDRAHQHAISRQAQFQNQFDVSHAYRLLDRNCVTELIQSINTAFPDERTATKALGGLILPGESQGFIPFRFFELVRARYPVETVTTLPSFRNRGLRHMALNGASLLDQMEEIMVPTARLYQARSEDSAFLLFTDDTIWPRPLFGVINLIYGIGTTGAGLVASPLDQGERMKAGMRGVLFSLPELLFWNIRKGSYENLRYVDDITTLEGQPLK